jgi:hypothetical protein
MSATATGMGNFILALERETPRQLHHLASRAGAIL